MTISGVDFIVDNSKDVENASAAQDDDAPIVAFNRDKDGNAATGAAAGVFHAKETESASKSGSGLGAKGEGGKGGGGSK